MAKYMYGGNAQPELINLRNMNYNINILFGLIVAGFMTLLFDFGSAEIVGYSLITFSVFLIFFITMGFSSGEKMKQSTSAFIMSIIGKGLPMLIILFLLSWVIAMNITYYNVISDNNVPSDYQMYARAAAWLFILLSYLLKVYSSKYIDPENNKDNVSKYSSILIVFLSSVLFWILTIMNLILRYYVTDG